MSLSDLAAFGSFVSGIAVLASLVFLYFQMRQLKEQSAQQTHHMKAMIWQEMTARGVNLMLAQADEDLCAAYIAGNGGTPSPEAIRQRQFMLQSLASSLSMEDIFRQWHAGFIADDVFHRSRKRYPQVLKSDSGTRQFVKDAVLPTVSPKDPYYDYLKEVLAEAEARPA
jgi:hypothetical protein